MTGKLGSGFTITGPTLNPTISIEEGGTEWVDVFGGPANSFDPTRVPLAGTMKVFRNGMFLRNDIPFGNQDYRTEGNTVIINGTVAVDDVVCLLYKY